MKEIKESRPSQPASKLKPLTAGNALSNKTPVRGYLLLLPRSSSYTSNSHIINFSKMLKRRGNPESPGLNVVGHPQGQSRFLSGRKFAFIMLFIFAFCLLPFDLYAQPCGGYNKETNYYGPGYEPYHAFSNTLTPPLFNWQMVQTPAFAVASIFFIDSLFGWATDGNGGFLKTTDSGFNWLRTQIVNGTGCLCGVYFINRDTGWICGITGLIRKTTNNGIDWIVQDSIEAFFWNVYFMNNDTGYITGLGNGGCIIKTTNSGETWQQIYWGGYNRDVLDQYWFNENTGWFCGNSVLLKTTNGGANFLDYYSNIPPTSNGYNGIWGMDFVNQQTGWISGGNIDRKNIYKTTDEGLSWEFQNNPTTQYEFAAIYDVMFINGNTGWGASYVGQIIVTTNGGINWITDLNSPNSFLCLAKFSSSKVWCGAGYGEIWYLDNIPPIGIEPIGNKIPFEFNLKQNYPNPFNSQTTIEFDIPIKDKITIKIYDLLGKETVELASRIFDAGSYKIDYKADNLASGVYIYTLEKGDYKDSKKMVLVK